MAHATNPEAVRSAILLGAHSVEHGYILDDECIELIKKLDEHAATAHPQEPRRDLRW